MNHTQEALDGAENPNTELEKVFRGLYRGLKREAGHVLAQSGLSNGDFIFMRVIAEKSGAKPSDIAEELGVRRGYISAISARLIARKLVKRSKMRTDARTALLEFTPKGKAMFRAQDKRLSSIFSTRIAHLDPAEVLLLLGLLRKLTVRTEVPGDTL